MNHGKEVPAALLPRFLDVEEEQHSLPDEERHATPFHNRNYLARC
jgi:hypothetical protein